MYVPGLKANLFSISRTVMYGKGTIIYHDKIIHIKPHRIESKTIAVGYYTSDVKLFILDCVVRLSEIIKTKCFIVQEIVKEQPAVFVSKAKELLNIIDSKIPVQVETKSNHFEGVEREECRNLPTSDDDTTNEFTLKSLFKKQKLVPNKDTNVKLEKTLQRVKMTKKVAINSKRKRKGRVKPVITAQKANIFNKCEYKLINTLISELLYNVANRLKHIGANYHFTKRKGGGWYCCVRKIQHTK